MTQTTFMDQKLGWAACRFAESTRRKMKGRYYNFAKNRQFNERVYDVVVVVVGAGH